MLLLLYFNTGNFLSLWSIMTMNFCNSTGIWKTVHITGGTASVTWGSILASTPLPNFTLCLIWSNMADSHDT